ncbi:MAG: lipopolysaccharide kinase InaA family protein [Planctomycetota bacterium]
MRAAPDDDLDRLATLRRLVLKDEPEALVEVLGDNHEAVVRKTYRNSGLRLLQTLWRTSRAAREFANLTAAERRGLPCTPPRSYSEVRRFGFVRSSTLVTGFVRDTTSLKAALAKLPRSDSSTTRRALATALGRLLARLHEQGLLWCTPMPRNVLVEGPLAAARLVLCDLPAVVAFAGAVPSRHALLDLYDASASPSRRVEWTATERLRMLISYHGGDRAKARATWRCLARRSRSGNRWRKNLSMALRTYILRRSTDDRAELAP